MTWDEVKDRIKDFDVLENNWDGQGADAPPNAVCIMAHDFAEAISDAGWRAPVHVRASPDGSIAFQWADGVEVEILMGREVK